MDISLVGAFLEARREALLSLDEQQIKAYYRAYCRPTGGLLDLSVDSFWAAVHKARTGALDLPDEARQESRDWLKIRGYHVLG